MGDGRKKIFLKHQLEDEHLLELVIDLCWSQFQLNDGFTLNHEDIFMADLIHHACLTFCQSSRIHSYLSSFYSAVLQISMSVLLTGVFLCFVLQAGAAGTGETGERETRERASGKGETRKGETGTRETRSCRSENLLWLIRYSPHLLRSSPEF